ncbi:MAG: hypothetical protein GVY16_00550 [Planctomycetes bacterium]|jgi:hypothetical protein|nr:transglutaminase domain-containing protein [Phycisphaerae bacterium]NBB94215.1 hypothetical protein [Planctomycetota bacterium]
MRRVLAILLLLGLLGGLGLDGRLLPPPKPVTAEQTPPEPRVAEHSETTILSCFERAARVTYKVDEQEYWQTPTETVTRGTGDCEDKSLYLLYMLRVRGFDVDIVFGVEDARESVAMHAWVECRFRGELYVLDPTNGFIARRRNMAAGRHMPVLGHPRVLRKYRKYRDRTGERGLNRYYEHAVVEIEDRQR